MGGYQTDFARNWAKEGKHISAMIRETVERGLEETLLLPDEIDVAHIGNFAAELYANQGHLGAFFLETDKSFARHHIPTSRHEAACASGSIALLAASAEIEAGRYDVAAVLGIELMKSVDAKKGGDFLGTAAWYDKEAKGVEFPFPKLFGKLGDEYDKRYGLKDEHLARISAVNYENAKRNPKAQTRTWYMDYAHACKTSQENPVIGGRIKITDCSQVTDGAAIVFLASESFAKLYSDTCTNVNFSKLPYIQGWGHHTGYLEFQKKMEQSEKNEFVLPGIRETILDAYERAGIDSPFKLDCIETHDCFTTSEYMAIDHFGITKPGESWKAIEERIIDFHGKLPINPSGGLIGAGHPVGATGVRQVLDCYKQVAEKAGRYQVALKHKRAATLNIGGSGTTSVSFIIGRDY